MQIKNIPKYLLSAASIITRSERALSNPIHIQIEPSTRCNLCCKHCISVLKSSNKNLSLDKSREIIDTIRPVEVTFSGRGEPLLNLSVPDMIKYCTEKGINTSLTTNFTQGKRMSKELVGAGIKRIRVSIDAAKKETYQSIRGKDLFEDVIDGIKKINAIKKDNELSLFLEFVIMKENFSEIPELLDLAENLGIHYINFRLLQMYDEISEKKEELIGGIENKNNLSELEKFMNIALRKGANTNLKEIINKWENFAGHYREQKDVDTEHLCVHPWLQCFISLDGDTAPCCSIMDNEGKSFGNIFERDFDSIWNGGKFLEIREAFREKRIIYKSCKTCPSKGLSFIMNKAAKFKFL